MKAERRAQRKTEAESGKPDDDIAVPEEAEAEPEPATP